MKTRINMSLSQFQRAITQCSGKRIALDTETTGLCYWRDRLTTVGFYCPDADLEGSIDIVDHPELQEDVRRTINNLANNTLLIFHNAKFDMGFLGIDPAYIPWRILDTAVCIHLLDSRYRKSLEAAEKLLLGSNTKREHIEEAEAWVAWDKEHKIRAYSGGSRRKPIGDGPVKESKNPKNPKRPKIHEWHPDKRQLYCINDCRVTYQLAETIVPQLRALELETMLWKEMEYLKLVYDVEHTGWVIDPEFIGRASMALQAHLKEMEEQLYDAVGYRFNYRSPKQLSKALYEDLGIARPVNPFQKIGTKGTYTTKSGVVRAMTPEAGKYNDTMTSTFLLMEKVHHPLGELVSSIREVVVLLKTLKKWMELMDDNCVIHTSFNLTGTRTGRLSSSRPNIQNVPSEVRSRFVTGLFSGGLTRTEEYNLRNAYVARPGFTVLSVDYKQMEMRMFGVLSQDPFMLDSLNAGRDVHADIAEKIWGTRDEIHREWSKTISFGLIYGMSTGSLRFRLNKTAEEAFKITNEYWETFPRIRPWLFEVIETIKASGYIRYWSGRIWREEEEGKMYKGANAIIQGGCADLLSIAALRSRKWLQENCPRGRIINFVHDELIFEIPDEDLERASKELPKIMLVEDLLGVKFLNDVKWGKRWGSIEKPKLLEEHVV